jgi:hypothetical protein
MSRYVLTETAQADLTQIGDYYLEEAGYRVARQMFVEFIEAFRFLAPTLGAGLLGHALLSYRIQTGDNSPGDYDDFAMVAETFRQFLCGADCRPAEGLMPVNYRSSFRSARRVRLSAGACANPSGSEIRGRWRGACSRYSAGRRVEALRASCRRSRRGARARVVRPGCRRR